MTITASGTEISYAGDGVSTVFTVSFPFDTAADLKVISTNTSTGLATVLSTGFAVGGGGGTTGTVTFTTAPAVGVTITILDNPALTQPADYTPNDAFPAETTETALDRVTRITKRLYQQITRAVRFDDGDPATSGLLSTVDTRKGKYLFFNAVTGAVEYAVALATTTLSQSIIAQLLNPQTPAEALAAVSPTNYWRKEGDLRRYNGIADGVTNNATAWAAAFAQAQQVGGAPVFIASSTTGFLVNTGVSLTAPVKVIGEGIAKSRVFTTADIDLIALTLAASKSEFADVRFQGKGAGATLAGVRATNSNTNKWSNVQIDGFGYGVYFAQGANSCYLNQFDKGCRIISNIITNIFGEKQTNQLILDHIEHGGSPAPKGVVLLDSNAMYSDGCNCEGVTACCYDLDAPSGSTFAYAGHKIVNPDFDSNTSSLGDVRLGATGRIDGISIAGGFWNPGAGNDSGVNAVNVDGLDIDGPEIGGGYTSVPFYKKGTVTNDRIRIGGGLASGAGKHQYESWGFKANYANQGTLTFDLPTIYDAAYQDSANYSLYSIASASITAAKRYFNKLFVARISATGAAGAGSAVYALGAIASDAQGGTNRKGAAYLEGDVDLALGALSLGQSSTAPVITNGATIATTHISVARVAPGGAVTGIIMQAGLISGQVCTVINESAGGNTVTFAASGTSNVANGVTSVIAGLNCRTFVWNSSTSLWYPSI